MIVDEDGGGLDRRNYTPLADDLARLDLDEGVERGVIEDGPEAALDVDDRDELQIKGWQGRRLRLFDNGL